MLLCLVSDVCATGRSPLKILWTSKVEQAPVQAAAAIVEARRENVQALLTCGARHHARGFCAPRAQDHLGCTPCAVKAPCMVCCRGKTRWVVRRDPASDSCRKPALP